MKYYRRHVPLMPMSVTDESKKSLLRNKRSAMYHGPGCCAASFPYTATLHVNAT